MVVIYHVNVICTISDQLLLTCGFDKTVNLWDMNTCSVKKCYKVTFMLKFSIGN